MIEIAIVLGLIEIAIVLGLIVICVQIWGVYELYRIEKEIKGLDKDE
jgi:hypothetical protein